MHKELPSKEAPCTNAKSRLRGCIVRLKRPISFAERHANEDALRNIPRRVSVSMFSAKALVGLRREHLKWEARLYMLFNSVAFAIFLPIVFTLYWMLNDNFRVQNLLLLIASYLFYGWWDWRFLFLIAACSGVNFIAGRLIYQSKSSWVRHTCLVTCCVVCLGALCVFKYYDFFIENFSELLSLINIHWSPWVLNLALPVGISFFTFQALSYTIDIALKKMTPTRDWIEFFTFIAFFPQLVAGPIERATHLLPQFQRARVFNLDAAIHGVSLITYGLFKKIVVADTLSPYVDRLYADPLFYSSTTCVLGAIFFSFQIYCDFSGYSDVARGIGRLLGFDLMLNFDRPYLAKTFSDFWRRWHISLSSWFRDYVYIPLGGSRVSLPRLIGNLWVVFLLSGLWHGASFAFIAWGALHALYLTLGVLRTCWFGKRTSSGWPSAMLSILFLNIAVIFAWIFFRAGTIHAASTYLKVLFSGNFSFSLLSICAGIGAMNFALCIVSIILLALSYLCPRDFRFTHWWQHGLFSLTCVAAIVFLGMPSGGEFIYFKF